MEYNLEDKKNIIYLRNQLINAQLSKLREIYSTFGDYAFFLDTLNIALDAEPAFFLIDDSIMEKAKIILSERRWVYDEEDFKTVINEIISSMNSLSALPVNVKNAQKNAYLSWQEAQRQFVFPTQEEFLHGLAYDAIVLEKLYAQNLSDLEAPYFLASTNYLAKNLPEFYHEDPQRINITLEKLDEHAKKRWIWNFPERAFAKEVITNLQKIKTKGE